MLKSLLIFIFIVGLFGPIYGVTASENLAQAAAQEDMLRLNSFAQGVRLALAGKVASGGISCLSGGRLPCLMSISVQGVFLLGCLDEKKPKKALQGWLAVYAVIVGIQYVRAELRSLKKMPMHDPFVYSLKRPVERQ